MLPAGGGRDKAGEVHNYAHQCLVLIDGESLCFCRVFSFVILVFVVVVVVVVVCCCLLPFQFFFCCFAFVPIFVLSVAFDFSVSSSL